MIGAYPLMPITATVGLAIGVVTIGGVLGVGITTDPDLVPNGEALAAELGKAFAELKRASGRTLRRGS
jgi:hypothetical protein